MKKVKFSKTGQFSLEYILLFAAVLAVMVTVFFHGSLFPAVVSDALTDSTNVIDHVMRGGSLAP